MAATNWTPTEARDYALEQLCEAVRAHWAGSTARENVEEAANWATVYAALRDFN